MSEEQELSGFELYKAEARKNYEGGTIPDLAEQMRFWQTKKAEAEEDLKIINANLDVLRFEAIPNRMDGDGIEKIRLDGVGTISLRGELFLSVKDKDHMFEWLQDNNFGSLIQPTVNSSTLKAFVKGRIAKGEEYGAEFLNVTPVTMAVITNKPKGSKNETDD